MAFERLAAALEEFEAGDHERFKVFYAAKTRADLVAWSKIELEAREKVAQAFFADGNGDNCLDNCRLAAGAKPERVEFSDHVSTHTEWIADPIHSMAWLRKVAGLPEIKGA